MGYGLRKYFLLALFLLVSAYSSGQFYNGSQMTFGKNRVQHNDFFWSFYRFERFDAYFNEYGRELAEYTGRFANKKLVELEDFLDYQLDRRLVLLIYNKMSDYRQSNMGLITGKDDYNLGGISTIIENKVFLYYEGDHRSYDQQITKAISYTLINEMIFGSDKTRTKNSSKMEIPDWYFKGLVSFLSVNWDFEIENEVKDGILTNRYNKLNRLKLENAEIAGHSFWKFISDTYGVNIIPNVLYITKINEDYEKGLYYVLGVTLKELNKEWLIYYKEKFLEEDAKGDSPQGKKILKKPKKSRTYQQIRISPDGRNIAYVTNELGQYKVWVHDLEKGKSKRIYRKEPKVEQIIDYSYPVITWHPTGKMLTMVTEEKGGLDILFYRTSTGKIERKNLLYFDKVLDISYSPYGNKLIFSAMKNSLTDLFLFDVAAGTHEQLTYDLADDLHPRYTADGNQIIFSSNRLNDTLTFSRKYDKRVGTNYELFLYKLENRSPVLTRLPEGKYIDKTQAFSFEDNEYLYLGDQSGIINRYHARFDSSISYIDTSIHYRYFTNSTPLTNYSRNIIETDFAHELGIMGEVVYEEGRYNMYYDQLLKGELPESASPESTRFREKHTEDLHKADSIEILRQKLIEEDRRIRDTLTKPLYAYFEIDSEVDINNYVFEEEKENYYWQLLKKDNIEVDLDTDVLDLPPIRIYETSFYNNYMASQVDFGFMGQSYQAFNGNGVYNNTGIGMLFNIGTNDLFEDYKIVGGFRFSGDFDSGEFLLSFENLKKRMDKQIIFHRQSYKAWVDNSTYVKIKTNQLFYSLRYPFNQVMAVKGTASIRSDRQVYLATNTDNLYKENLYVTWANLKLEYIYDNTRYRGINFYNGTRFKIFIEAYRQIERKKSDVFIIGGDFRHYLKIHRDLIWANRFAASTSFGHNKLIYYMGAIDNWFMIFDYEKMFNRNIPVDQTQNYVFQTLATNMRGFKQNIRNGNTFALINSEIRWPIIRYLADHPISNKFLHNFHIIGFADVGTAWTGWNPYSGNNSYDKEVIENGPITVTVHSNREPIVAGYGFGARSTLFGYFVRADYGWGVENFQVRKPMFYFSFSLDF